jgi:hypothetical protein
MKGLESFGGHHTCLVCASDSAASHCLLTVRPSFASSLARKASFPEDCPLLGRSPARWAHVDPIALIERKWFSPASSAMGEVGRGSEEHQSWCSRVGDVQRRSRLSWELSMVSPIWGLTDAAISSISSFLSELISEVLLFCGLTLGIGGGAMCRPLHAVVSPPRMASERIQNTNHFLVATLQHP